MISKKGFTLIELLVVIAIIGILASIVLVSFPGATKKAKDSRIVGAIAQARTVMTYVYANDGNYDTLSETTPADEMVPVNDEVNANAPTGEVLHVNKNTGSSEACMWAKLNAKASYWYCADSQGKAGFTTTDPSTACPDVAGATAKCPADVSG